MIVYSPVFADLNSSAINFVLLSCFKREFPIQVVVYCTVDSQHQYINICMDEFVCMVISYS